MTKIAFCGLAALYQPYFQQALTGHEVQFYDLPIVPESLDPEIEVLSVFVQVPVTAELLDRLPRLRLIACRSTGYNNVDLAAAKARNITVTNVPSYGATTVAEYTFTLLLMLARRMTAVLRETTDPSPDRALEQGFDLHGKTLGIVGLGSIGQGVARIARGFGMNVLAHDIRPQADLADELGLQFVALPELLNSSDVVSLHAPSTPDNYHFIGSAELARMKPSAILLNTARGELVDSSALLQALQGRHIAGAGLDVIEGEHLLNPDELTRLAASDQAAPQTMHHALDIAALRQLPNVLITNHNAFNTVEAIDRINATTLESIQNFIAHKEVHAL